MMKLLSLASLLLVAIWMPARAAAPPAAPSFGESVEVNVVNVDVYAVDKDGHRVTGLGKDDFELLEDGKKVSISNFESVQAGPSRPAASAPAPSGAPAAATSGGPQDDLSLVVYFDDFNIRAAHRARAVKQLRELLTQQLDPGTRVMLVTYDLGPHIRFPFTSDPAVIDRGLQEIEKLSTHGDETERDRKQAYTWSMDIQRESLQDPTDPIPCPLSIATPARHYAAARRQEVLRTLSALTLMINSLSGVPGRKALLHVSDGIPMNPGEELFQFLLEVCGGGGTSGIAKTSVVKAPSQQVGVAGRGGEGAPISRDERPDYLDTYDSLSLGPRSYQAASQAMLDAQSFNVTKELQLLAAHANAQRVTLYTLQASGVEAPYGTDAAAGPEDRLFQFPSIGTSLRMNHRESLQLLADATGGRAILDVNDFRPDLLRMREDLDSFYSLGFTPAHTGDGREHKIEVRAKRPGLHLRYRQSYRDKPALEKVVDRTLAALFYGIEDNPLAITTEVGEITPAEEGQYAVPIQLKIPLFKLAILSQQDQTYTGKLRLLVALRDEAGGMSPMRQVEVPINIPRKEVLSAMGQYYIYTLTLKLKPGLQHVAVAVRDDVATTTSYLSRPVNVNATAATSHP